MNITDYEEEYFRLVKYYQDNPISKKDQYCETHHIIPRSCGGSNDKSNLVNLPADIHYKVHCYLPFVFKQCGFEVEYYKMVYAWKRLMNSIDDRLILMNIDKNAIEYRLLREEYSKSIGKMLSKAQSGSKNSNYGKHWYKDPTDKTKYMSIKEGDPIPEGWVRGKWQKSKDYITIKNILTGQKSHIEYDDLFEITVDKIPDDWEIVPGKKYMLTNDSIIENCAHHKCKYCGAIKGQCEHPEICKHYQLIPKMVKYFNFDESTIGTPKFYDEFNRVKNEVYDLYWNQKLSLEQIKQKIGYTSSAGALSFFISALIGRMRNLSEALKNFNNKNPKISKS